MIERAAEFAAEAHQGQFRKYTGEPYINHPQAVVDLVKSVEHTPEMIAAAWLHDTVEDTNVTHGDILNEFGEEVATMVMFLTDISRPQDGNRKVRKTLDRLHISHAPRQAKTIKLADIIDNTSDILDHDPEFAKIYVDEKKLILTHLLWGDPALWQRADYALQSYSNN